MRWRNRQGSRNVEDRRKLGGKKTVGGGLGFIAVAIVVMLMGGDPTYFLQEGVSRTIESRTQGTSNLSEDQQQELAEFASVVLAETEDTWGRYFAANGQRYPEPSLVLFSGGVRSACGQAQSAMGPFYCPADQKLYIDLDFFHDLRTRHGAPGDFAQAYVIAHEVGHHIQNITGVLSKSRSMQKAAGKTQANEISVRTELMADCLAGIWAHDTDRKGLLEDGDIEEALKAASQIGDDTLQKQSRGFAVPDSFTHGSSAQRYEWFNRGFESGDPAVCQSL